VAITLSLSSLLTRKKVGLCSIPGLHLWKPRLSPLRLAIHTFPNKVLMPLFSVTAQDDIDLLMNKMLDCRSFTVGGLARVMLNIASPTVFNNA